MKQLFLFITLLTITSLNCFAAWDGTTEIWSNGDGTLENPYQIVSAENLAYLSETTLGGESWTGVYFVLLKNVDLAGSDWIPIGNSTTSFDGSFDGTGHYIYGMLLEEERQNCGLFGKTGSNFVIKNLGINNDCSLYPQNALYFGAICGYNSGLIINCYNKADISASGGSVVGGICGLNYGTITNCYNTGDVYGQTHIGGIAGSSYDKISSSYNTGLIQGTSSNIGAIVGNSNWSSYRYCFYNNDLGTVSGAGDLADNALNMKGVSMSDMKTQLFVDSLNNGPEFYDDTIQPWILDTETLNNEYPIFIWELTTSITTMNTIPFSLYPNPTIDRISIETEGSISNCVIYSVSGQRLKEIDLTSGNEVSTKDLNSGTYFLRLYFSDGSCNSSLFIKK